MVRTIMRNKESVELARQRRALAVWIWFRWLVSGVIFYNGLRYYLRELRGFSRLTIEVRNCISPGKNDGYLLNLVTFSGNIPFNLINYLSKARMKFDMSWLKKYLDQWIFWKICSIMWMKKQALLNIVFIK